MAGQLQGWTLTAKTDLLTEALEAQQRALDELFALTQAQARTIEGLLLGFRGFIDLLLDEKQRTAFRAHVDLMAAGTQCEGASVTRLFLDS